MSHSAGRPARRDEGARNPKRHGPVRRDQDQGPFSLILDGLLDAIPLAIGAVLVDQLGESVDYAGELEPFDLKVAAAHFQIVLQEIRAIGPLAGAREFRIRARHRSYVLHVLDADYSLLLVLHRHAAFSVSRRAMNEGLKRLSAEAGLDIVQSEPPWYRVEVKVEKGRRPVRLRAHQAYADGRQSRRPPPMPMFQAMQKPHEEGGWTAVEVMGVLQGMGTRERAYRIRLGTGAEMTLVRERHGLWFVDEPP